MNSKSFKKILYLTKSALAILFIVAGLSLFSSDTHAASTTSIAGTVADADVAGNCTNTTNAIAWGTTLSAYQVNDGTYGTYGGNSFDASEVSTQLRLSNFHLSSTLVAGSKINGITVNIDRKGTSADVFDFKVWLMASTTAKMGSNHALAVVGTNDWGTSDATVSYGGTGDLWSVNNTTGAATSSFNGYATSTTFGLILCVQTGSGDTNATASVDFVSIDVDYSLPALTQDGYRWRANHQGETGTTWLAAEDTVLTGAGYTMASTTRLRMLVDETASMATTTLYQLEYATTTSAGCSALTYVRLADQASSTGYAWKMSPTAQFANGAASTNVASGLTDTTGSFRAGTTQDTTARLSSGIAHAAGEFTELEWSIEASPTGTVNGQSYCFRVTNADDTTNFTYSVYPKINLATSSPALTQLHFRWRADQSTETGTIWMASEDARLNGATDSNIKTASTTRLRFVVDETGLKTGTSTLFQLEYAENTDATACSAASYTKVPDTASTEHWEMSASTNITDAAATTNNGGLSDPSSGSFVAGQIHDTSSRFAAAVSINPANNFTEVEWAVKANASNATNGGSYCFRVTNADDTTNFTFTQYARITLATSTTALSQLHYRWRADNGGEIEPGGSGNAPPFWDSNFTNRRKITFNNAPSSVNLHNFPVPIILEADANDDTFGTGVNTIDYTKTLNHGFDVRFVNASSTLMLKHEVENWNESGTSTVWVKLPFLEAATTSQYIWMYYNNSATTTSGVATTSVWDSNFVGVWHLSATSTAARKFEDSTSNAKTGIGTNFDSDEYITTGTILDGALDFDGTNDYGDVASTNPTSGTSDWTISAWIQRQAGFTVRQAIVGSRSGTTGAAAGWNFDFDTTTDNLRCVIADGSTTITVEGTAEVTDSGWYHVACVLDRDANGENYINGKTDGTVDSISAFNGVSISSTGRLGLGVRNNNGSFVNYFDGAISEIRLSTTLRSADWIQQEYRYGAASSTTHTFGSEETFSAGDGASFLANEDTHLTGTNVATASTTRFRILVDETNSLATTTLYQLEYATSSIVGFTSCGALSTWVPVSHAASTTEAGYSYAWVATTTASYANRAATTRNTSLSAPGSGSFVAGQIMDYNATSTAFQVTANNFTELEWAIEATSEADGNSYCFRVSNAGDTTNITYSVYGRISLATSTVTFTQNAFRLYKDNDTLNPGTAWDGLAENAVMTSANERVGGGDVVRMRVNVTVSAALSASAQAFGFQYAELPSGSACSDITSWTPVGAKGSDITFRLVNTSQGDSTTITTTLLSESDVGGLLSELNPSATNPNAVSSSQQVEYDWPVQYATARLSNATLCFRMVKDSATAFTTYTKYPQIVTNIVGAGDGITVGAPIGGSGAKGAATTTGGTSGGGGESGGGAPPGGGSQGGGTPGGGGEVWIPFFRYFANVLGGLLELMVRVLRL